jgi:hypothetical protein
MSENKLNITKSWYYPNSNSIIVALKDDGLYMTNMIPFRRLKKYELVKYNGVHPTTANFVDNPYLMYY